MKRFFKYRSFMDLYQLLDHAWRSGCNDYYPTMSQRYMCTNIHFKLRGLDDNGSRRLTVEMYDGKRGLACFVMGYIPNTIRVYPYQMKHMYTLGFYGEYSLERTAIHEQNSDWIGWINDGLYVQSLLCDMLYISTSTDPIEPIRNLIRRFHHKLTA